MAGICGAPDGAGAVAVGFGVAVGAGVADGFGVDVGVTAAVGVTVAGAGFGVDVGAGVGALAHADIIRANASSPPNTLMNIFIHQ